MEYSSKIFGEKGQQHLDVLSSVVSNFEPTKYTYMPNEEFKLLMDSDFKNGLKQYWTEILYRVHFAAVSSIYRNYQWALGMETSYKNELFLPFCSCFRALIESAADTFDCFEGVPLTLAEKNKIINKILTGKYTKKEMVVSTELESKLIHFSHARKVNKSDGFPENHNAKSAAKYISNLDKDKNLNLYSCYSDLCEYTHPAARSTGNFVGTIDENTFVFSIGFDKEKIENLASKYQPVFETLLSSAFNSGLVTLKLLRKFSEPTCQVPFVDTISVVNIPLWNKCIKHFK